MSDDLIAFLKAWHEWATNGAPDGEPFDRSKGLCGNSRGAVSGSLIQTFQKKAYPFGYEDFYERLGDRTQHECPKRLAWVRERLIEAGELVA